MQLEFARPDASQLSFHLFERALHPELFDVFAETHITAIGFDAVFRICSAGHVVEFRSGHRRLTEVVAGHNQELPHRGRRLAHRLKGGRDVEARLEGVAFCGSAHVEHLVAEVFHEVQHELQADAQKALLSYEFPTGNRLLQGGVSVMQAEATPSSLLIHAFHTFPDSLSILRTQSLYEY
jgi:hypothetical protein